MTDMARMDRPLADSEDPPATAEAELERLRARLQTSLGVLEHRLKDLRDWRAWIRRRPVPFLLGAFAAGVLLGLRRRRSWPVVTGR
jgi:hypothetical protein